MRGPRLWLIVVGLVLGLARIGPGAAADAPPPALATGELDVASAAFRIRPVDDAWRAALPRDADAATQAYMDRLPAAAVARSNAYFEGGYWLILWNVLLGLAVSWVLLARRRMARLRDACARVAGARAWLRDGLVGAAFALASGVLSLPLTIYQGFVREHEYGMATQPFGAWFGEQVMMLGVSMLVTAVLVALLYAVFRQVGSRWWIWGTVVTVAFMAVMIMLGPVLIEPLFNTYKPVEDGPVKTAVLAMAHADGVPADNVYVFDASRQTTHVSANVSGLFGSAAVRLNDNLLRRSSLSEIRAVMGHELGHYVMNHIPKMIAMLAWLVLIGFLFAQWAMQRMLARHGTRWGLLGTDDVAGLPLLAAVFSVFFFLATPVVNTLTRVQEIEADRFGLNLAREPHGEAEVDLKLTEYRKPDPGPIEEFIFFDHPSTRFRIHDAMRWREAMGTP